MSFGGPSSRDKWWDVHQAERAVIEAAKAWANGEGDEDGDWNLASAVEALLEVEARADEG